MFIPQIIENKFLHGHARLFSHAKDACNRLQDKGWFCKRRKFDEPYAVLKRYEQIICKLQGETGLACATRTDQREQARALKFLLCLSQFAFASYKGCELNREVIWKCIERYEGREFCWQIWRVELKEMLGPRQIFQAVF